MEDGSGWTPKYRKTETDVKRCYTKRQYNKIHEGKTSKGRSARAENSFEPTPTRERPKKKKSIVQAAYLLARCPVHALDPH